MKKVSKAVMKRSGKRLEEVAVAAAAAPVLASEAANADQIVYTAAQLRPGMLLLHEFSRPGGIKYESDGTGVNKRSRRIVTDSATLEKLATKIVNAAYAKYVARFAHTPWGFFCTQDEVEEAQELLAECRLASFFANQYAKEQGSDRRLRVDVFPMAWDHNSRRFQVRIGELIASKLLELREVYSQNDMKTYRVRMDKCRNMDRLVIGDQSKLVRAALLATEQQRKVMVAIYGDKRPPLDWIDPRTGRLKEEIQLDFKPIDTAIRHFYPSWTPPIASPRPEVDLEGNKHPPRA